MMKDICKLAGLRDVGIKVYFNPHEVSHRCDVLCIVWTLGICRVVLSYIYCYAVLLLLSAFVVKPIFCLDHPMV